MSSEVKDGKIKPVFFLIILFAIPNLIYLLTFVMGRVTGTRWMTEKYGVVKTEALLIHLDTSKIGDKPGEKVDAIESGIKRQMEVSRAGEVGGKICKEGTCVISVLGMDTNRLYQLIRPYLKDLPAGSGYLEEVPNLKNTADKIRREIY